MLFSVLQLLMEKCKGQSLENRLSCIFRLQAIFSQKRCKANMIKHRQQSSKIRARGVSDSATAWTATHQVSPGVCSYSCPLSPVIPSNHLILCRPLLLLPSIFPSIRVFFNESALRMRWPQYWSFSLNISPSNEHLQISFRMGWLDKEITYTYSHYYTKSTSIICNTLKQILQGTLRRSSGQEFTLSLPIPCLISGGGT